jgi:hypothetical protein
VELVSVGWEGVYLRRTSRTDRDGSVTSCPLAHSSLWEGLAAARQTMQLDRYPAILALRGGACRDLLLRGREILELPIDGSVGRQEREDDVGD